MRTALTIPLRCLADLPRNRPYHIPTAPRKAPLPGALRRSGSIPAQSAFRKWSRHTFQLFRRPALPATGGTPPCPWGYGDITPHTWVAKNATILVALIAYMYSLVIVAMIVNQFAENRKLKQQEKARLSGSAQARRREAPPSGEND